VAVLALVAPEASASSTDMSSPATALRPAAARARGSLLEPMEVPRAVFLSLSLPADFAAALLAALPFGGVAAASSALIWPALRRCLPALERISRFSALRRALTASSSASLARSAAQSAIDPDDDSGAPDSSRCGASSKPSKPGPSGRDDFAGDLAMAAIWEESMAKERGGGSNGERSCVLLTAGVSRIWDAGRQWPACHRTRRGMPWFPAPPKFCI